MLWSHCNKTWAASPWPTMSTYSMDSRKTGPGPGRDTAWGGNQKNRRLSSAAYTPWGPGKSLLI